MRHREIKREDGGYVQKGEEMWKIKKKHTHTATDKQTYWQLTQKTEILEKKRDIRCGNSYKEKNKRKRESDGGEEEAKDIVYKPIHRQTETRGQPRHNTGTEHRVKAWDTAGREQK